MFIRGFIAIAMLVSASSSFADVVNAKRVPAKVGFWIDSRYEMGSETYYDCDTVEFEAEQMLEQMGATNIDVYCTGGIDQFSWNWDAFVEMSFDGVKVANSDDKDVFIASWKEKSLSGWDNCALMMQLFDKVSPGFEVKDRTGSTMCGGFSGRYDITYTTLE